MNKKNNTVKTKDNTQKKNINKPISNIDQTKKEKNIDQKTPIQKKITQQIAPPPEKSNKHIEKNIETDQRSEDLIEKEKINQIKEFEHDKPLVLPEKKIKQPEKLNIQKQKKKEPIIEKNEIFEQEFKNENSKTKKKEPIIEKNEIIEQEIKNELKKLNNSKPNISSNKEINQNKQINQNTQKEKLKENQPPKNDIIQNEQKELIENDNPTIFYEKKTHFLTEKIIILTEELEKIQSITAQSIDDNIKWKIKYEKLKELYIKNVDEDFNIEEFFENSEFKKNLNEKPKDEKILAEENNKLEREIQLMKEECDKIKKKILKTKEIDKKNNENEIEMINKVKILQNELEMLKIEEIQKQKEIDPRVESIQNEIDNLKKENEKIMNKKKK